MYMYTENKIIAIIKLWLLNVWVSSVGAGVDPEADPGADVPPDDAGFAVGASVGISFVGDGDGAPVTTVGDGVDGANRSGNVGIGVVGILDAILAPPSSNKII